MSTVAPLFYRFAGFHSLLIGLLPFYIPILLWQQGYRLAEISLFIAITGVGFVIAMSGWKALYKKMYWRTLLIISFLTELLLVGSLIAEQSMILLVIAAVFNGFYNCFYWITQRTMFSALTQQKEQTNTGKHYGNFQIVIVVLLKVGILIGGYLLAENLLYWLLAISALLSFIAMFILPKNSEVTEFSMTNNSLNLGWKRQLIFIFDGIFLFLESYFWVLTLYFITNNNVMNLGILVVSLTVMLSLIFWLIKNKIDALNQHYVFYAAVFLYTLSWLLRGNINDQQEEYVLFSSIMLIAFLTSFFRLSFNKLFFDDANGKRPLDFILVKSYLSQGGMIVFFGALALFITMIGEAQATLSLFYWCVVPIALLYALYPLSNNTSSPVETLLEK